MDNWSLMTEYNSYLWNEYLACHTVYTMIEITTHTNNLVYIYKIIGFIITDFTVIVDKNNVWYTVIPLLSHPGGYEFI